MKAMDGHNIEAKVLFKFLTAFDRGEVQKYLGINQVELECESWTKFKPAFDVISEQYFSSYYNHFYYSKAKLKNFYFPKKAFVDKRKKKKK